MKKLNKTTKTISKPKKTIKKHWSEDLKRIAACPEAIRWCKHKKSFLEAWKTCENGDWLYWYLELIDDIKYYIKYNCDYLTTRVDNLCVKRHPKVGPNNKNLSKIVHELYPKPPKPLKWVVDRMKWLPDDPFYYGI
jgi:hypothetical protein